MVSKLKFEEKVYSVCKEIPKGKVSTYKEVGRVLNSKAYRAIGQALRKNPYKYVPCHRVIGSSGKIGGFRGNEVEEKEKLLKEEGVEVVNGKVNLSKFSHRLKFQQ